jgi:hypothetical protein
MSKKMMVLIAVLAALSAFVVSCSDNDPEENRSVMTVLSFNENSSLISDVLEQGDDLTITTDDWIGPEVVPVVFYNRPYNTMVVTRPDDPHGEFIITRYTVDWVRTDGGTPALPRYEGGLGISVPTGEDVEGMITLVTFENKSTPPLSDIAAGGPNQFTEIRMTANVTFYGHEAGTDRETAINTSLAVLFVDLFVESD